MAVKINVEHDFSRKDFFIIDPFDVFVKEGSRGRKYAPEPQTIIERAVSMMDNGQQTPVQARKIEQNRLQLVSGFTRTAAARLIREGFTDLEGVFRKDEKFMLKTLLVDANEEKALIDNIIENAHRNDTSPIDDAFNQARLRDQYGKNDTEIAKLYQCSPIKVGRLRKLLSLSEDVQRRIHDGKMSVSAGLDLLDIPEDKRAEVIATAVSKDNGSVDSSEVRNQVREHILRDQGEGEGDGVELPDGTPLQDATGTVAASKTPVELGGQPAKRKKKGAASAAGTVPGKDRTMKDVRKFLKEFGEEFKDSPNKKKFAKSLLDWIAGTRLDATLKKTLVELVVAD